MACLPHLPYLQQEPLLRARSPYQKAQASEAVLDSAYWTTAASKVGQSCSCRTDEAWMEYNVQDLTQPPQNAGPECL
jgi:hypothetical protein